jgi:hypothetical protein
VFFRDLLAALASSNVPYCVVGGVAVNLHGVPRMTYDIDIVVDLTPDALTAAESVLVGLGLRCRLPVALRDFADRTYRDEMRDERSLLAVTFTDPQDPLREVDILVAPSVEPADLVARAITLDLDGVLVRVASRADLMELKRTAGRAQDHADLRHLERLERGEG